MSTHIERLFGLSPNAFAKIHWGRCLVGEAARADALAGWMQRECFDGFNRAFHWRDSPRLLRAAGVPVTPEQAEPLAANGLAIQGEVLDPATCRMGSAIKGELGLTGTLTTFGLVAPQGAAIECDFAAAHRILVQTEGRGHWRLHPGEVETNVELGPGGCVYLPPGAGCSITASIGATVAGIAFTPARMNVIVELLMGRDFSEGADWRCVPAAGRRSAHATHLHAGFERMRETMAACDPEGPVFQLMLAELVADLGPIRNAYAASLAGPVGALDPGDRLYVTPYLPVRGVEWTGEDGEPAFSLFAGAREISDSGPGAGLLATIVRLREFTAGDSVTWLGEGYGWDAAGPYLENLMEQGLLVCGN